MKRALVTGGAGFIGSHVVDELVAMGHEVHVIDNFMNGRREHLAGLPADRIHEVDIRDQAGLSRAVADIAPQLVYHLAAIHFIPYCNEHPTESVLINIQGTQNLLDALAKDFVASKFDLKHLVRTICKSSTYQLASTPNRYNAADKSSFSRYYPRRMNAEVLLDAVNAVTGSTTAFASLPASTRAVIPPWPRTAL